MSNTATRNVDQLLAGLEADRRAEMATVRDLIRGNLPAGYEETVSKDMIVYQVPRETYPDTYNKQPLWLAALASQKSGMSLHLMPLYMNATRTKEVEDGFMAAGKKLDMGKACIRFRKADALALNVIADIIAGTPMDAWIATAKATYSRKK